MTRDHAPSELPVSQPQPPGAGPLPRVRSWKIGKTLLTWVQILAIIGAGAWGAYTFIYEQIQERATPINISIGLQLRKVGLIAGAKPMLAVSLHVSATNPSLRVINLLPSAWVVTGLKANFREATKEESFDKDASEALSKTTRDYVERYADGYTAVDAVAAGRLFDDTSLNPKETIERTVIIHVPQGAYDIIDALVLLPRTDTSKGYEVKYSMLKYGALTYEECRDGSNGACNPISDKDIRSLGNALGLFSSESQLSLW